MLKKIDRKMAMNLVTFASIVIFIGIILFTLANNPTALSSQMYTYSVIIVLPIIVGIIMFVRGYMKSNKASISSYISAKDVGGWKTIATIIGIVIFIPIASYGIYKLSSLDAAAMNYVVNLGIFLAIVIGLAIFYKLFSNKLAEIENNNKLSGFIVSLIFYIPCLFSDFLQYLLEQYKITPNIVFVLFILEILVILLCVYLPNTGVFLLDKHSKLLLNEPKYLNKQTYTLAQSVDLYNPNNIIDLTGGNSNYTLSMWIFVNPNSSSNAAYAKETDIFSYSYTDASNTMHPKPRITYSCGVSDNFVDTFHFYLSSNSSPINLTLVGQRWNHVAFNYNSGIVDIFINGHLERTVYLNTTDIPIYSISDSITVGSPMGIDGAISCIVYTSPPMSEYQIANSYNLLMNRNPPKF